MTTPFAFVPRAVSKYTKEWQGISTRSPSPSPPTTDDNDDDDNDDDRDSDTSKGKEPARPKRPSTVTEDIASLICLALSDYNIWLDADFRWKLDVSLQDGVSPDDAAFVPINYLLRRVPFRSSLPAEPSETEVVKALRAHATHTLEVRMRLPPSAFSSTAQPASVWYGTGKTSRKKDVGGYEVRRKDWSTLCDRPSRGWTHARWEDRTAYVECIPPQYRTVGGIVRFADALLAETEAEASKISRLRVQCVTLPSHYLDKPGDAPKCKGYALVTLSTQTDLDCMLDGWPWKRRLVAPGDSAIVKEAHRYGFRAVSKARWDALNEEYLIYQQSLIEAMARADARQPGDYEHEHDHARCEPGVSPEAHTHPQVDTQTETEMQMQTTPSSPYPFDCLVFVRNVHPGTNKTTLRSLFVHAFEDENQAGTDRTPTLATGLDYIDFTKGTNTCHLRLASPSHTNQLLAYFSAQSRTQGHALDTDGRVPLEGETPIEVERVRGKREGLYWEEIPERVRRQAVDRVVQAQRTGGELSRGRKRARGC